MRQFIAALTFATGVLGIAAPPAVASSATFHPQSGPVGTTITVSGLCDQPGFDERANVAFVISRSFYQTVPVPPPVTEPWTVSFQVPTDNNVVRAPFGFTIVGDCIGPAGVESFDIGFFAITESPPIPDPISRGADFTG
ncbi:MAG: hypothetical protein ACRDWD_10375 [Acidimicrobiia bacterium]